jgi:hypothetical protein
MESPLFDLSDSLVAMKQRYKTMVRKDEKLRQESIQRKRRGMTWITHYVELIQQENRRGNYGCW